MRLFANRVRHGLLWFCWTANYRELSCISPIYSLVSYHISVMLEYGLLTTHHPHESELFVFLGECNLQQIWNVTYDPVELIRPITSMSAKCSFDLHTCTFLVSCMTATASHRGPCRLLSFQLCCLWEGPKHRDGITCLAGALQFPLIFLACDRCLVALYFIGADKEDLQSAMAQMGVTGPVVRLCRNPQPEIQAEATDVVKVMARHPKAAVVIVECGKQISRQLRCKGSAIGKIATQLLLLLLHIS